MRDGYEPSDPPPVLLGTDTETRAQVFLPHADRELGVALIGKSGTGKSTVLEHLILADLEHGTPGMVIDPHGMLAQRVMQYATAEQAQRIILLEASLSAPFGLNLLAVRDPIDEDDEPITWAADSVVATIKKLYGEDDAFLPRLERYLNLSARTLIPSRHTLLEVPLLFEDPTFRQDCLSRVTDPNEQRSLRNKWGVYERMRSADQLTHTEALLNRVEPLLAPQLIQRIVGSPETTVPFDQVLNGDKMLLVSLPSERLTPARCDFIGALLLCAFADRVFARNLSGGKPRRVHLYLDEYQRFATSTTAELLEQGRKYRAGVTLAHQTLYQIPDLRIRNAARHAGSLIVLGLTRPDAEQLAGEFPIRPKEEWVETIEEADGTEPKLVLSATPGEDIYIDGHSDPNVDLAARSFLAYSPVRMPDPEFDRKFSVTLGPDKRKSAGVLPRPGGVNVDDRVQLTASAVQPLLVRAMAGELASSEALADALIEPASANLYRRLRVAYFTLNQSSPAEAIEKLCHCPVEEPVDAFDYRRSPHGERVITSWRPRRGPCRCDTYYLTESEKLHNEEVRRLYRECAVVHQERLRTWLLTYLDDHGALLAEEHTEAFKKADSNLNWELDSNYWDGIWEWVNPLSRCPDGHLEPAKRPFSAVTLLGSFLLNNEQQAAVDAGIERWRVRCEAIDLLRQRLRWLVMLADGLRRSPILVPSGEQQPRMRTRHIVHGAQTHADALAEFAGRLVHPPQRYVAHVRRPEAYHEVKLRPPLEDEGTAGDHAPVSNPTQPDDIRSRSRALYDASDQQATVITLPRPEESQPRRVTRKPRPQPGEDEVI